MCVQSRALTVDMGWRCIHPSGGLLRGGGGGGLTQEEEEEDALRWSSEGLRKFFDFSVHLPLVCEEELGTDIVHIWNGCPKGEGDQEEEEEV